MIALAHRIIRLTVALLLALEAPVRCFRVHGNQFSVCDVERGRYYSQLVLLVIYFLFLMFFHQSHRFRYFRHRRCHFHFPEKPPRPT